MKSLYLLVALLFTTGLLAQPTKSDLRKHQKELKKSIHKGTVIWSLDTIFNAGEPVCLAEKVNKIWISYDVSVKGWAGTELIFIKTQTYTPPGGEKEVWDTWTFFPSGKQCQMQSQFINGIARMIAEGDLIRGDSLNEAAVDRMITIHGMPLEERKEREVNTLQTGNYQPVERNRNGMVMVSGNKIKQSNVLIGTATEKTDYYGGKADKQILIYLPNGTLVARAQASGTNSHSWQVTVQQTGRAYTVEGRIGQDVKAIAIFLVDHYYL
jgi:hypothetical protein